MTWHEIRVTRRLALADNFATITAIIGILCATAVLMSVRYASKQIAMKSRHKLLELKCV